MSTDSESGFPDYYGFDLIRFVRAVQADTRYGIATEGPKWYEFASAKIRTLFMPSLCAAHHIPKRPLETTGGTRLLILVCEVTEWPLVSSLSAYQRLIADGWAYENNAAANSCGLKGWRSSEDSPTPT